MNLSIINQFKTNFLTTIDRVSQSLTPQQKRVAIFVLPLFLVLAVAGAVSIKLYKRRQEIKALEIKALKIKAIAADYSPDIVEKVRKSSQPELLQLIAGNGNLFYFADSALKSNKAFIKEVAKVNAYALSYIAPKLKKDEAFMLELIAINLLAIQHVPQEWRCSTDFISKVLQMGKDKKLFYKGDALSFASEEVQKQLRCWPNQ